MLSEPQLGSIVPQWQQFDIMKDGDELEDDSVDRQINRYLTLSATSLALNIAGVFISPFLTLLGVLLISYVVFRLLKNRLTTKILKGKSVGVSLVEFLAPVAFIATGHFVASAFAHVFLFYSEKLVRQTEDRSQKSLMDVFGTKPRSVWIQKTSPKGDNGARAEEIEIPFEQLARGHIVAVHAGETIPIDGVIHNGGGLVDQSALTGESQPIQKEEGDQVLASTIVLSGQIYIEVEETGQATVAAQIGKILSETSDFKSSIQSRGERIIDQGAWPTLGLSLLALPLLGSTSALAVLLSSFGYQMKFAAPLTVLNFLRIASENGVLIKDGRSLELLSTVDTFVFDKTGTLTGEVPTVGTIHALHGYETDDLLTYAAAAEHKQTHPIARAIRHKANEQNIMLPPVADAAVEIGYGVKMHVQAGQDEAAQFRLVRVGSRRFMELEGIAVPPSVNQLEKSAEEEGTSLVYVAVDAQLGGIIELTPTIRPEARQIVRDLKKQNMSTLIISGDRQKPTQNLARALGVDDYFAEVLPHEKASLIEQLQAQGRSICFVGDGINDSIALKKANVSISLSGASNVAVDSASIVLMNGTLDKLLLLVSLAHEMDTNLKTSTIMTVTPGLICVSGVFFFHLGIFSSILLYGGSLALSVSNAFLPLITHKAQNRR
ncbi:MAG: heavy metal translocating P-type ATPase [Chloroflexota bacterium]